MSVDRKVRQKSKREGLREIRLQLDDELESRPTLEEIEEMKQEENLRMKILNGFEPDMLDKVTTLRGYDALLETIEYSAEEKREIVDPIRHRLRSDDALRAAVEADMRIDYDDDPWDVDYDDYYNYA
jgi:hypothetical protein